MNTKLQLLINTKMMKNETFLAYQLSDILFIMLINVKMPTIVDILTFMSITKSMLFRDELKTFITSERGLCLIPDFECPYELV